MTDTLSDGSIHSSLEAVFTIVNHLNIGRKRQYLETLGSGRRQDAKFFRPFRRQKVPWVENQALNHT